MGKTAMIVPIDYILDLTAGFAVGGISVMAASMAAQRFGSKVGGFIAGLPSTAVLTLFFITYTEGARHGFDVTSVFPLTISVNAVFLAAFAALSRKSFSVGLGNALGFWTMAQSVLLYFHPVRFLLVVTLGVALFLASLLFIGSVEIPEPATRPVHHGVFEIALRAISGGAIIVLSMIGSRFGGPVLGGILSAFPATVVATLIITNAYGGKDLARAMARPMMVSGVVNCMVFALVYRQVILHTHILGSLTIAYAATLVSAAGTFYLLNMGQGDLRAPSNAYAWTREE